MIERAPKHEYGGNQRLDQDRIDRNVRFLVHVRQSLGEQAVLGHREGDARRGHDRSVHGTHRREHEHERQDPSARDAQERGRGFGRDGKRVGILVRIGGQDLVEGQAKEVSEVYERVDHQDRQNSGDERPG